MDLSPSPESTVPERATRPTSFSDILVTDWLVSAQVTCSVASQHLIQLDIQILQHLLQALLAIRHLKVVARAAVLRTILVCARVVPCFHHLCVTPEAAQVSPPVLVSMQFQYDREGTYAHCREGAKGLHALLQANQRPTQSLRPQKRHRPAATKSRLNYYECRRQRKLIFPGRSKQDQRSTLCSSSRIQTTLSYYLRPSETVHFSRVAKCSQHLF
jgi:hypothetical protein